MKRQQTWKSQQERKRNYQRQGSSRRSYNFTSKPIRRKNRNNFFKKIIHKLVIFFIVLGLVFSGIIFFYVRKLTQGLPDPNQLIERDIAQSTKIFDRTREVVLYEIHGEEQRTLVNLHDLPDYIKNATIAIEDKEFYHHKGVSIWGIFRGVVLQKIRGRRVQGGSTLTQQLIKNAILSSERTIDRKIKEWVLAYRLEKKFTKDEILQMYFNEIPYGSTAYGVEAASRKYFGKNAKELNLAEAAILAALPQAPSKYSPYGPNRELLIGRQKYILDLMQEQGYIDKEEAEVAKNFELEFKQSSNNIIAPHFVMYVKEILSEKYGEKMIEQGGLQIYTTVDLYKQKIAEEVIEEIAATNKEKYNASNAALLAIDPKNGEILSMVGSRDFFSEEIDGQFNITTASRQPGSSIKPIVYATAFSRGYTANTIVYDVLTNFSVNEEEAYEPHNYDLEERGPVTLRKALAGSLNIPAVKTLYLAGLDNVIEMAQNLGYTTLNDKDRLGLTLVLGGGEVKMIEHVNAYSAFAREGKIYPTQAIIEIRDKNGDIIFSKDDLDIEEKQVMEPVVARAINDILSDNHARAYAFGYQNHLNFSKRPVAVKTGTTNNYKDAWTIGYTPSIVAGVWAGNNDNTSMKKGAGGGKVAAPIWRKFIERVLGDTPVERFKKYEEEETGKDVLDGKSATTTIVKVDKVSGLLATENTPEDMIEERKYTEAHSILYYIQRDDPLGDDPIDAESDPQFKLWEDAIKIWMEEQNGSTSEDVIVATGEIPTEYDNVHTEESKPQFKILTPSDKEILTSPFLLSRIEITNKAKPIRRVSYYLNNNLLSVKTSYPFNLENVIDFLDNGFHNLKVKVCDEVSSCAVNSIEFNLNIKSKKSTDDFETRLNIIEPGDGAKILEDQVPIKIKVKTSNVTKTAKINLYIVSKKDDDPILVKVIEPVDESINEVFLSKMPPNGEYYFMAKAYSWGGKIKKSDHVNVEILKVENE